MKKLVLLLLVSSGFCLATNAVYIAQSSAGSANGSSCANAEAVAYFNTSGNWSGSPTGVQIGPGTTVHLCGTFTGTANTTELTFQGSGTSGNPVTLLFEPGAILQAPYWSSSGAIVANSKSYITIDGGSNGIIQDTANGSALANKHGSTAIAAVPCTNCEFKNLTISNLYVHTQCEASSGCDSTVDQTQVNAIQTQGSNVSIDNNTIHDVGWAIYQNYTNDSNVQIFNNNIYNMDHGLACAGASFTVASEYVHDNHFHDMAAWDTGTADTYHHDGIHCFNGSGGKIQNLYVYNNLFDGNEGLCCVTSWIFLEGTSSGTPWTDTTGTLFAWNNIIVGSLDDPNGQLDVEHGANHKIFNNTILGVSTGNSGTCLFVRNSTGATIENNVIQGCDQLNHGDSGSTYTTIDYNLYGQASGGNPYLQYGSHSATTLAAWQTACSCDTHSQATFGAALASLSSEGVTSSGFLGITTGANLSSSATGSLATLANDTTAGNSRTSAARPASTAWDIGAYMYVPPVGKPAQSFGTGPTITWYYNSAHTQPVTLGAMEGQTLYGVLSAPGTAVTYGTFSGTLAQQDSTHITYVAPASIIPLKEINGLQVMPQDYVFFSRIDNLPTLTTHYYNDGSGYCEGNLAIRCAGDPTQGTGMWTIVEPVGTVAGTSSGTQKTCQAPGSSNGCAVDLSVLGFGSTAAGETIILDSSNPQGSFRFQSTLTNYFYPPDWRFHYNDRMEGGIGVSNSVSCTVVSSENPTVATPAFPGCIEKDKGYSGQPIAGNGIDIDHHSIAIDPTGSLNAWTSYQELDRFGETQPCAGQPQGDPSIYLCNTETATQLNYANYFSAAEDGLAGTPENDAMQDTGEELQKAALGGVPITHQLVGGSGYMAGVSSGPGGTSGARYSWPAFGPCYNCEGIIPKITDTPPVMGQRFRLSSTRTSINLPILSGVTVTSVGSGYTPGSVIQIAITGCSSIDGVHPASAIAFIGKTGGINNDDGPNGMAFVTNTGMNCSGTVTATAPTPTGGVAATLTPVVFSGPWQNTNVATALYNQDVQYGWQLDDINGFPASPVFRVNSAYDSSPYAGTAHQIYSSSGTLNANKMFSNWFLYDAVDSSSMLPSTANGWPSNMKSTSWLADPTNSYEGSTMANSAIVKVTATTGGAVSFTPIGRIGVGVASVTGAREGNINIVSGMTAFQLPSYVVGDPTNSGVTWSWVTDPCPGFDTLTSSGMYTACPQFNGTATKVGAAKLTSVKDPAAFNFLRIYIAPVDTSGNIRIDINGPGGTFAGNTWAASCCLETSGSRAGNDGAWPTAKYGTPAAPDSVAGEAGIYPTYLYNGDIWIAIVVPNGNYKLRGMMGFGNNGDPLFKGPDPSNHSFYVVQVGDAIQKWMACIPCNTNNEYDQPYDVTVGQHVTDNVLRWAIHAVNPQRWAGVYIWNTNNSPSVTLSGFSATVDTTTTPYWEIGDYAPNLFVPGDQFKVGLSDGVHITPNADGLPPNGVLQMYVRNWYTTKDGTDAIWHLDSGPGSIGSNGVYVAPSTQPDGNACAVIRATSASLSSLTATAKVCIAGSTYQVK